jgi:hypothetical protein
MTDWQPGDPLYEPRGYVVNLPMLELRRDQQTTYNDGARWPVPHDRHNLDIPRENA